jgi:hypothetical protein
MQDVGSKAEGRRGNLSWGIRCRGGTDLRRVRSHGGPLRLGVVEGVDATRRCGYVRGTQNVVAALRSGGEEQCIAATERPTHGAGRGHWAVFGAGSEVGLSLRGTACFWRWKGEQLGGRGELGGEEQGSKPEEGQEALWRACRI